LSKEIIDTQFDDVHHILRNNFGLIDPDRLEQAIADLSRSRLEQLDEAPLLGNLDIPHLRSIHRYIFQDVFPWAGDFREVRTSRSDSFGFPPPQFMVPALEDLFAKLRRENQLRGLSKEAFAGRAAFYLGELNAIHPFREGNGRSQREFLRTLALQAGHRLTWAGLTPAENNEASRISFAKGDNSAFCRILLQSLSSL
jgi:cell filamentation protein